MIASRDPYKQEVVRDTERFQPKAAQQTQQIEALQQAAIAARRGVRWRNTIEFNRPVVRQV